MRRGWGASLTADDSTGSLYEGKAHGPIELTEKVVAISIEGKPCEFRDVSLRLDEHLDLQLRWTGPLKPGIARIDQNLKVTFEGGTTAEFLMLSHKYHFVGHEEFSATSRFSPLDLAGKSKGLAEAVILGGPAIHPKKVGIVLEFGNLAVTVQPFDHFLALGGGGARMPLLRTISHRAVLRSLDRRPLKAAKVYEFLDRVSDFLGFIKGTRVGYGEVRNAARDGFRCLGFTRADRLEAPKNWFHWALAEELPTLFATYMTIFQTPEAKRGVGRALAYYKISNLSRYDSVETAVIMSAAGLETLAAYILGTSGGWTASMLRNVSLAEQIRACTRLLKIEGDPADQSELLRKRLKAKKGQPARDGFSLLTEFRNGVTHSTPFTYDLDIFDAWDASQWLLEMQVLALFGYRGKYQDRRLQMRSYAGNLATLPVSQGNPQ
ncbi:hypothetical protein X748_27670 [Mesorhizobium sp. LNJC386A00]|nr:hypothetical protein X748_27670 [Mesorhizobium sp. LNJC386A00]